jgi:hypothetical protein
MTREEFNKATKDNSDEEKVALAACVVGPNQRRIAQLTGLKYELVREYGQRLRENAIWVGSKVSCEDPENGPDGIEVALWGAVAKGYLETVPA